MDKTCNKYYSTKKLRLVGEKASNIFGNGTEHIFQRHPEHIADFFYINLYYSCSKPLTNCKNCKVIAVYKFSE